MIDPTLIPVAPLLRTFAQQASYLLPSAYYQCTPSTGLTTDASQGWNTLRVMPFVVPNRVTLVNIGAEFTAAGATGAVYRMGIYADNGKGFPGALVLDAGTIDGTSATVQQLAISQAMKPGLYWVGGVVQGGTTGTQPTIRTLSGIATGRTIINNGFQVPVAAAPVAPGFAYTSVTGALPATWTSTVSPSATGPRIFVQVHA